MKSSCKLFLPMLFNCNIDNPILISSLNLEQLSVSICLYQTTYLIFQTFVSCHLLINLFSLIPFEITRYSLKLMIGSLINTMKFNPNIRARMVFIWAILESRNCKWWGFYFISWIFMKQIRTINLTSWVLQVTIFLSGKSDNRLIYFWCLEA